MQLTTHNLGTALLSLPSGMDVEVREAGVQWDAVCAPAYLGDRALAALDEDTGAVIRDPYNHLLYWLVRCGAADHWRFPEEAHLRILGRGSWVGVPPRERVRSAAAHWVRLPVPGRELTPPHSLHAALQVVIAEGGPL